MAKEIDKIIKSPTPPKDTNVLWDNGENLKINRNGKWENVSGGDNNYSKLETALKFSSITIIGDEGQDYHDFVGKYHGMPFESFMEEELQVQYGNNVRDVLTVRSFLEDLHWYKSCRLLLSWGSYYYVLNLSYYRTNNNGNDLYEFHLIFGGKSIDTGVVVDMRAYTGSTVDAIVDEV